jgi:hypothetical protein
MTTDDKHEKNDQVLKKLARLFVETPDSSDQEEIEAEFTTYNVDVVHLGRRISKIVETAAEKDRLAWLEEYRQDREKGSSRPQRVKKEQPNNRTDKLRLLESLQAKFTNEGMRMAVGFKKLDELSDEDLSRIIAILQEENEESAGS